MKDLESLNAAFVIDTFLLLLIGVGPKIALVPFLEATADMPEVTKRRVLRKMLTTAATVAALLLVLGGLLTRLLHFSPGALGVAAASSCSSSRSPWCSASDRQRRRSLGRRARTRCGSPSTRWPCPTCSTRPGSSSWYRVGGSQLDRGARGRRRYARRGARARRAVSVGGAGQQPSGCEPDAGHREGVRFPAGRARRATGLNGLSDVGVIHLSTSH